MAYARVYNRIKTPQSLNIPGEHQAQNHAGGFVYQLSDWDRLDRWLILGAPTNTYYQKALPLARENAECVLRCLKEDGPRTVRRIAEISVAGRAPRQGPVLFALALAEAYGDAAAKEVVAANFKGIVRIPTHLFEFLAYVTGMRGWGRHLKHLVERWYALSDPHQLAYHVVKYQNRQKWTHRDVLSLIHLKASPGSDHAAIYHWIMKGGEVADNDNLHLINGFEKVKTATSAADAINIIDVYKLPREAVPTQFLTEPGVWEALLYRMPLTAMIRNLATMTRIGLLTRKSEAETFILGQLGSAERLRKARIHPIQLLSAHATYSQGHGFRSNQSWEPLAKITEALDDAFYESFACVPPTGKRHLIALDVSGSMASGDIAGVPGLVPARAAAAMALVTLNVEPNVQVMAFADQFRDLPLRKDMRLDEAMRLTSAQNFGRTDCAVPALYTYQHKLDIDAFITITDNETWAGQIHPSQALRVYRNERVEDARNIVMGMTATEFTIADPNDVLSLDVVGFDAAVPSLIGQFMGGDVQEQSGETEG